MPSISSFFSYHKKQARAARWAKMMKGLKAQAHAKKMQAVFNAATKHHRAMSTKKLHPSGFTFYNLRRRNPVRHTRGRQKTHGFASSWYKHPKRSWNKKSRN